MNDWNTQIKNLKKHSDLHDLINSEGTILGLLTDVVSGDLYLKGFLDDGSGNMYFKTDRENLYDYLKGNSTLKELVESSLSETFAFSPRQSGVREVSKLEALSMPIGTWNSRYNEISSGMTVKDAASKFNEATKN
jgi:hypothetical protein